MNHDARLSIVMIYYTVWILNLERILTYGETLKWSYIPMDWVIVDGGWWQLIFLIEAPRYLIGLRQCVPLGDPKDM